MKNKYTLSVIGFGRFGSFWAEHLSVHHPVYVFDQNPDKIKHIPQNIINTTLKECLSSDYIFLTISIRNIKSFLAEIHHLLKPGSVLIDCASVKLKIQKWFSTNLSFDSYYAHCHPLFGPDSAKTGLDGNLITLSPGRIPYRKYRFLVNLIEKKLKLNILTITPDLHDRLMAYNLNLIHHLGRTFKQMDFDNLQIRMAGIRKLMSITDVVMNDSDELFEDFYRFNPYAKKIQQQFLSSFKNISPLG